jgi:hypothetical protein
MHNSLQNYFSLYRRLEETTGRRCESASTKKKAECRTAIVGQRAQEEFGEALVHRSLSIDTRLDSFSRGEEKTDVRRPSARIPSTRTSVQRARVQGNKQKKKKMDTSESSQSEVSVVNESDFESGV